MGDCGQSCRQRRATGGAVSSPGSAEEPYLDTLARVIADVVEPGAAEIDATGSFPRKQIDALASAGHPRPDRPRRPGRRRGRPAGGRVGGPRARRRLRVHRDDRDDALRRDRRPGGGGRRGGAAGMPADIAAIALADIAAGRHLTTLAFSESGSRSHFWAPLGTAVHADGADVRLDASKSWVTSAGQADSYVWSSRPLAADGPMTLWLRPGRRAGPVRRRRVRRPRPARQRLGPDDRRRTSRCRSPRMLGAGRRAGSTSRWRPCSRCS